VLDDPVHRSLNALSNYFVGDYTVGEALSRVCAAALEAVTPARSAGVSTTVDARIGTYVFTHPEVVEIDRPQYETGEGPCVDAFRVGEPVLLRSTRDAGPYPSFRAVAQRHGILSVMSLPMSTGAEAVGALNLYAEAENAFTDEHLSVGQAFATHAAFVIVNHQAYWDARSLSENLVQAMESRATIEQAKGVIMAATSVSPEEAFEQLKRQSQHENLKLRDVAAEIVRNAQRPRRED
jgi:GAF domain-containing protein